eukprot:214889_1
MYGSQILASGKYYGTCAVMNTEWNIHSMLLKQSNNIFLSNNIFAGYNPGGYLYISESNNVTLFNNTFQVDDDYFFYGIFADEISWAGYDVSLRISSCSNTTIVYNQFIDNKVDIYLPWIYYMQSTGINCLYGNTFTFFAFLVYSTNVTSCLRP